MSRFPRKVKENPLVPTGEDVCAKILGNFGSQKDQLLALFLSDLHASTAYGYSRKLCTTLTFDDILLNPNYKSLVQFAEEFWQEGMMGLQLYEDPLKGFGLRISDLSTYMSREPHCRMGMVFTGTEPLQHYTYFSQMDMRMANMPFKGFLCGPLRLSNFVNPDPQSKEVSCELSGPVKICNQPLKEEVANLSYLHVSRGNKISRGALYEWDYGGFVTLDDVLKWTGGACCNGEHLPPERLRSVLAPRVPILKLPPTTQTPPTTSPPIQPSPSPPTPLPLRALNLRKAEKRPTSEGAEQSCVLLKKRVRFEEPPLKKPDQSLGTNPPPHTTTSAATSTAATTTTPRAATPDGTAQDQPDQTVSLMVGDEVYVTAEPGPNHQPQAGKKTVFHPATQVALVVCPLCGPKVTVHRTRQAPFASNRRRHFMAFHRGSLASDASPERAYEESTKFTALVDTLKGNDVSLASLSSLGPEFHQRPLQEKLLLLNFAMERGTAICNGGRLLTYPATSIPPVVDTAPVFDATTCKRAKTEFGDVAKETAAIASGGATAYAFLSLMRYCGHDFPCAQCGTKKTTSRADVS